MGKIPDTGNQISMGRISKALGLTNDYPPPSGSNISLNANLGANRSNAISPVSDIPLGGDTWESSDFGGLETHHSYTDDPYGSLSVNPTSLAFDLSGSPSQQVTITFEGGSTLSITEDETWINWNIDSGGLDSSPCVINVWCDTYAGFGRTGFIDVVLIGPGLSESVSVHQAEEEEDDPEF